MEIAKREGILFVGLFFCFSEWKGRGCSVPKLGKKGFYLSMLGVMGPGGNVGL